MQQMDKCHKMQCMCLWRVLAVTFEIKLLLKVLIYEKGYFDLSILNERLSSFVYGRNESRTKPPKAFETKQILRDSSLNLSGQYSFMHSDIDYHFILASQVWNFAIVLSLIIGHLIPEDDPHWECYLLLLQIIQYCTAKVTSPSPCTYLASLIDQHHQTFVECYPGVNILPKMHYIIHFPNQILRYVNCMCIPMQCVVI